MTKLSGAILIMGTSTLMGFLMAERLNERSRMLRSLIRLLNIIKTEIGYHSGLLTEVFQKAAQLINDPKLALSLAKIAQNIGFGSDYNITQLWEGFINEKEMTVLLKEDRAILKELGLYLGSTDREDQAARIEGARIGLQLNLEGADLDRSKGVRLYRYFGFAAGAVLVCMLA
jgi:stage III sporulation protein AB